MNPTQDLVTQIGVAGILVMMILDRVFAFVSKARRNGAGAAAGEQSTDYWRAANKQVVEDALQAAVLPILRVQTDILARMETRGGQSHEAQLEHGFALREVRESLEKLRVSSHATNATLQRIAAVSGPSGRRSEDAIE